MGTRTPRATSPRACRRRHVAPPSYHGRPVGLARVPGACVSRAHAPSRASGREPRRPRNACTRRGAAPLPAVHACRGRPHTPPKLGSPPRCTSLASKHLVYHAYKRELQCFSVRARPPPEFHGPRRAPPRAVERRPSPFPRTLWSPSRGALTWSSPDPALSRSSRGRRRLPPPHAVTRATPTPTPATGRTKVTPGPSSAPPPAVSAADLAQFRRAVPPTSMWTQLQG
jgi:hypothetical protein